MGLNYDDLLQLDITPSTNTNGTKVRIRITLPGSLIEKVWSGKQLFGLHKTGAKWEAITLERVDGDDDVREFTLTSFSPVIIGYSDGAEINVTLENVKGGAGIVYEGDRGIGKRFLPIGETVPVPAGTDLMLNYRSLDSKFKEFIIEEENEDEPIRKGNGDIYQVPSDKGDITITPVFEKYQGSNSDDEIEEGKELFVIADPDWVDKTTGYTGKLRLYSEYDYEKELSASNWELSNNFDYNANDKFSLDKNGNLSSVKELNIGDNRIDVSFEYNNKKEENVAWISVGSQIIFRMYLGQFDDGTIIQDQITVSNPFLGEKDLYKICEETLNIKKYGFFGDFEFDRWDKRKKGEFTEAKGNVGGNTAVFARYINKKTGKIYAPVIERMNSATRPDNKPTTKPSDNSSSSSSSSDSSSDYDYYHNQSALRGNWKVDSKGWRYSLKNGGYATNIWGTIDGFWYYFGSDGYMKTGWVYYKDGWYYLNPESDGKKGQMKTGWVFDKSVGRWFNMDSTGKMRVGWQLIDGKWYYFKEVSDGTKGVMMADTWIGNYYVDSTGAWDQSKKK